MNGEILLGCLVLGAALCIVTYLVLWSRRTIDRIAESDARSAREIEKEVLSER